MQIQPTTNKQISKPAFGQFYAFPNCEIDLGEKLYQILTKKGALYIRDFYGAELDFCPTYHLATGTDSVDPIGIGITEAISILGQKFSKTKERIIEIVLDSGRTIEEQLHISLRPIGEDGTQEIDIVKK